MMKHQTSHRLTLTRRNFLYRGCNILACASLLPPFVAASEKPVTATDILLSASGKTQEQYGMAVAALSATSETSPSSSQANNSATKKTLENTGSRISTTGFRGHEILQHPRLPTQAIYFARRPGNLCCVIDITTGNLHKTFTAKPQHHFFGHGCSSADGKTLFTTEGNYETGEGKIGLRDTHTFQQIGEFKSFGIGPHQIKLMPDGNTLAVANGGIRTHPNTGRKALNLKSMSPSLTYINASTGEKLHEYKLEEPKASIRHMDIALDGTVTIAMQMQREASQHNRLVPLLAIQKPGGPLKNLMAPDAIQNQFKDYLGSICINNLTRVVGVTSPRGNIAAFWHLDTEAFMGYHSLHDVCGITKNTAQNCFIISNSQGQVRYLDAITTKEISSRRQQYANTYFDNHLLAVHL